MISRIGVGQDKLIFRVLCKMVFIYPLQVVQLIHKSALTHHRSNKVNREGAVICIGTEHALHAADTSVDAAITDCHAYL